MFKSIEYKLILYLVLLIISIVISTYLFILQHYIYVVPCIGFCVMCIVNMVKYYKKFNANIITLLNAIENDDYSFHFTTNVMSRREKELNMMMNRIKSILVKAKEEIIRNEKFLSVIVENTPSGMIVLDSNNNIKQTNQTTIDLLGLQVLTHINQLRTIEHDLPEKLNTLDVNDTLQLNLQTDTEELKVTVKVSIIQCGRERYRILSLYNIQNELEANELESWSKLIRVMTHEIMNSIAPITSLTETLLFSYKYYDYSEAVSEEMTKNTIEAISIINSTTKGLKNFVESYRQFSKIAYLNLVDLEIKPFVQSVIGLERTELENRKISIELNIDKDVNISVKADQNYLNQVLVNLMKNAIEAFDNQDKEPKIINIHIKNQQGKTEICIANNGPAIPADVLDNIFVPFFTTKDQGSGIGLSLSRYIMRRHSGNLKHNYKDGWTIFTVVL